MATFLLIHGSWHGAWCWERLVPRLEERGHRAAAIDLPAHGADTTPAYRATLGSYSRRVRAEAARLGEKPILVGHSMGGMVVSQAAADAPDAVSALVYVCAFAPLPGESVAQLARLDSRSLVAAGIALGLSGFRVRPERAKAMFYAACTDADADWASQQLCADPALPLVQRLQQRSSHALPRAYIECTGDQAISIERQRAMADPITLAGRASMDSDHSPFLSAPEELAAHLHALASRVG